MELQSACEYMHELLQLQIKAKQMKIVPRLMLTVDPVNIPGLSVVLYKFYKNTQSRHLTKEHKSMLLLRQCYCHPSLARCYCLENQALLEWCWLKFASVQEVQVVAHMLAEYVENYF